jgi:hypothetical protein
MTAVETLARALDRFLDAYRSHPELVEEQRGWSPVIALAATDAVARVSVSLSDGQVTASAPPGAPTLEIRADLRTLCDVLELRRDPNEPYLFGELVVQGPEADFLRLDYIASRLCAR